MDSQLEAPFSLETLRALCKLVGSLPISSDALCASCYRRIVRASDLAFLCKPLISVGQVSACCRIRAASGAVTSCDVLCWWAVCVVGFVMPRPPRRTGKAMSSRSASLKAFWPVREGRKRCQIASSKGWKRSLMSTMVLARNIHLFMRPWVNAAHAAWGWVMAMDDRYSIS